MNPANPTRAILVSNASGAVIPPRSVVVVTGTTIVGTDIRVTVHTVNKFNGQRNGPILVTGPSAIYAGNQGAAFSDSFVQVAINPSDANPVAGDEWGPVPNQWYIGRRGRGFFASGYSANTNTIKQSIFTKFAPGRRFHAVNTSSLATGTKASPSSCTADIWVPDPSSGATVPPLIVSTDTTLLGITVGNYGISTTTTTSSPNTGWYGRVEWMAPNWVWYWLECEAG